MVGKTVRHSQGGCSTVTVLSPPRNHRYALFKILNYNYNELVWIANGFKYIMSLFQGISGLSWLQHS